MLILRWIIAVSFFSVSNSFASVENEVIRSAPTSFSKAKKIMAKVYADNPQSFYCGCAFKAQLKASGKGKKLTPDLASCGYKIRKQKKRAQRIEWEHVMPAHHFGQHMACWKQGGRKACKKDPKFRAMEADLVNLVPAVGEVNGDRSNYKFGLLADTESVNSSASSSANFSANPSTKPSAKPPASYGACAMRIDFKAKRAEPPEQVRGDIARIYFYMSEKYNIPLSDQQQKLFQAWAKQDPADDWEVTRQQRLAKFY